MAEVRGDRGDLVIVRRHLTASVVQGLARLLVLGELVLGVTFELVHLVPGPGPSEAAGRTVAGSLARANGRLTV